MHHDPMTPKVKICGMTNRQDGELAVELGAWALGMIFWEESPRRCGLVEADELSRALRRRVELCGVFVNESLDRIAAIAEQLHLSIVQLHGDEGPAFCGEVKRRTGAKVCKAVQVGGAGDVRALERYHVDYMLVDGRGTPGQRGGTGNTFDWALLAERRATRRGAASTPLILSGGLAPENVAAAIGVVHPFAVDVASGVEAAPGRKDPARMREFFAAVSLAEAPVAQAHDEREGDADGHRRDSLPAGAETHR